VKMLITGGTGSFGNAFLDYMKDTDNQFIIYSRDERKQFNMYINRRNNNIKYIVGDIRDKEKLIRSMKNVDYVIHAAALKHVPTGENFPMEVIKTNTLGTKNVIDAADYCNVRKVVYLSTDKAVQPVNAYGMSKALAEKIISVHEGSTECVTLRYGNVLGTRGSVVPLFLDQITRGLPITITNLNMTRFLLTLRESVKLSLKCLETGDNGDLFVIRSPAFSIKTLVDALELNFGKIKQKVIGIRPSEKIHETLLTAEENHRSTTHKDNGIEYAKVPKHAGNTTDLFKGKNYKAEPFTSENTTQLNPEQVSEKLKETGIL